VKKDCCSGCVASSGGVSALARQANDSWEENSSTRNEAESVLESITVKSDMLVRDSSVRCTRPCEISHGLDIIREHGAFGVRHPGSSCSAEVVQAHQAEPIRRQTDGHAAALDSLFDSVDLDGRPPALVSSDSSSRVLLCSHDKEHKALCKVEVHHTADRDNDENSSGCTHPITTGNEGYKPHYLGNHRIRKLLASKVRKAACKTCGGMSNKGMPIPWCLSVFPLHS